MGCPGARRDPPVHVARVVPRLVDPGLIELHAAPAKVREVPTGAGGEHPSARRQIQAHGLPPQGDQVLEPDPDAGLGVGV